MSGGEQQRLKLAAHMAEKGGVYVLDEPTAGLHLADVERLLGLLDRLVDSGNSVIVIEHPQGVMAHADRIIDRPLDPHRRAPRGLRPHLTEAFTDTWPAPWGSSRATIPSGRRVRDRLRTPS